MTRREAIGDFLGIVASYALLETLFGRQAFARPIQPVTDRWLKELQRMSADLKADTITPVQWQNQIKALFDKVDLNELLRYIDFEKLTRKFDYPDRGVSTRMVTFPRLGGLPADLAFMSKVFGMKQDRAIIPHGHRNMVSSHLVLKGKFHLRQYEKTEEDRTHMVIKPTVDETARPGSHSSISDERNNIHWLKCLTPTAFTFDVIVLELNGKPTDVDNIDPYSAEKVSGGLLRARKVSVAEGLRKYGHDTHH